MLLMCFWLVNFISAEIVPCTKLEAFFPPKDSCVKRITDLLDAATKTIYVQCYSFTSKPIAEALLRAKNRGVKVVIIADESQKTAASSVVQDLAEAGIDVVFDDKPAIAHCKIMIIDAKTVLTGSYNWTAAAEEKNAENLIIFENQENVAALFFTNWQRRFAVSSPYLR